ncbi:MAG: chemotaxis protein CheB [Elusimicrobiota bacterium]|nr:chemotaxis protein CheB [Elusimicrobiota bacterium]
MKKKASPPSAPSFPIVGIGASAGGLEAVTRLLTALPTDTGMTFVVVQHLDPSRKSLMAMLLQRATSMPVSEARNGGAVLPNRVYVIPPNTHMCVRDNALRLIPRPAGVHALAVNCFLHSLAEERGNKAIAVILSGTASDGSLGVKAIKAEGGVVFAQDEESAGFFGMPQSAADTGMVDFVLAPEGIAKELAHIARHPILSADLPAFDDASTLGSIFQLLQRGTGVDFSLYKPSTIQRRLMRRLLLHKLKKLEEYKELLAKDPDEVRALHDDLLIHVTHFFREPKAIAALRAKVFPRILKSLAPDAPVRVWVAGCSTGEEAYSLAIELFDFLGERDCMNPVQIFATDISEVALERARAGAYPDEIKNFISPRLLRRFFTKADRGYVIVKRVRDACVFARQDLTKDPPFANVDLISCCNVLIYLGRDVQKQILPMFHYALKPSGALMLSSAETVGEFSDLFTPADPNSRLYLKNPAATNRRFIQRVRKPLDAGSLPLKEGHAITGDWPENDIQKTADRLLLARFAPAGVVVGGDLNVLSFRGRVSRYLEPATGSANLNLLKMLPVHAGAAVKSLIQKARKTDAPAQESGVELGGDEDRRSETVTIEAIPFRLPLSGDRYFIVLFDDDRASVEGKPAARTPRTDDRSSKRLKAELAQTRGYLQTIVEEHDAVNEELKAANEEVISSNEELQSTNEELEIAKEELQAANEELSTVNEELHSRNEDLGRLNDDLQNLISSVHLPIVMVSSDLRVRRFSPMAEKLLHLGPDDIGRPIGNIKLRLPLPNIEEIINEVIDTVATKELEVRDKDKHSFSVRVRPYKTADSKIEGAVIVFVDNDPIERSIEEVKDVPAFEAALEISGEPLAVLDAAMRVRAGSRSLYQAHGLTESALGRSLFEIEDGRWDLPALREKLARTAKKGEGFTRLPLTIAGKKFAFSARRIKDAGSGPPLILLSINAGS